MANIIHPSSFYSCFSCTRGWLGTHVIKLTSRFSIFGGHIFGSCDGFVFRPVIICHNCFPAESRNVNPPFSRRQFLVHLHTISPPRGKNVTGAAVKIQSVLFNELQRQRGWGLVFLHSSLYFCDLRRRSGRSGVQARLMLTAPSTPSTRRLNSSCVCRTSTASSFSLPHRVTPPDGAHSEAPSLPPPSCGPHEADCC